MLPSIIRMDQNNNNNSHQQSVIRLICSSVFMCDFFDFCLCVFVFVCTFIILCILYLYHAHLLFLSITDNGPDKWTIGQADRIPKATEQRKYSWPAAVRKMLCVIFVFKRLHFAFQQQQQPEQHSCIYKYIYI